MADTAVAITAGAGTNIDTRTEGTNGNHRQVVVLGDPATNAGVAAVDATNGLSVNVTNASLTVASHAVTNAGTFATQVTSIAAGDNNIGNVDIVTLPALAAGTNNIGDVDVLTINGVAPVYNAGNVGATTPRVTLATDDAVGAAIVAAINTAADPTVNPAPSADSADGLTIFRSLDLDESEEEVKATAGNLYKLRLTNFATSVRYVKLYNATAANVTVGTTTPIDTIPVPAGSSTAPTVITESFGGLGMAFATALCLAATTGLADNDTGAPAANDVVATAYYK
jgi:hypothetical protein